MTGIIMMYDIKKNTDGHRNLKRRKPPRPKKFVSINNAKQIFKSFFGDKLGELELEGLMLKADLNNNGKIEIEELTSFLR